MLWFADGSNYPGTANIRQRKRWFEENLRDLHRSVSDAQLWPEHFDLGIGGGLFERGNEELRSFHAGCVGGEGTGAR